MSRRSTTDAAAPLEHPTLGATGTTLTQTHHTPGCPHCMGLRTLTVTCEEATLGTIEAVYPWNLQIDPDHPEHHPATPHYELEWEARDNNGTYLPIHAHDPGLMAVEMLSLARAGTIPLGPPPQAKKK